MNLGHKSYLKDLLVTAKEQKKNECLIKTHIGAPKTQNGCCTFWSNI